MGGEEPANDLLSGANDIDNAFAVDKFSKKGEVYHSAVSTLAIIPAAREVAT